ncbi:DNA methyltransferase [Alphaproteobacteria bacterium]|nr:DNA methyltransferase [Alphaproteobacteria bacterium]
MDERQPSLKLLSEPEDYDIKTGIEKLSNLEWKKGSFEKQSWGHSMHRIGPYVGRIKPAFAHFLIKYLTKKNDLILDPFAGVGTICFESIVQSRNSIGCDINPYALAIAKAKANVTSKISDYIKIINNIKIQTDSISLSNIPSWVKEYYNQETLKEILFCLNHFKKSKNFFLYGNLVAISQGHRVGHLSKPCAWTLPYKPRPDDPGEYREVKPRLIEKIKRTLKDDYFFDFSMRVIKKDSRNLSFAENSIDAVISSPPYFNTLDYINSHRLRLAIIGVFEKKETTRLKKLTIQSKTSYLNDMNKVIKSIERVLKPGGICCFILGDLFEGKKVIITANVIKEIFMKYNFTYLAMIEDKIPVNKSVQKKTNKVKSDRILIVQKK